LKGEIAMETEIREKRSPHEETLRGYKRRSLKAAKELFYPEEVFDRIEKAESFDQVTEALSYGRKHSYRKENHQSCK